MAEDLQRINLGYNPVNKTVHNWNSYINKKSNELEKYWLACKLSKNLGDISQIQALPYADLWTFSYPCTDISLAGNLQGMVKGETRSGLLYEVTRLLESTPQDKKPKYLLMENVENLVNDKFKPQFDDLCEFLKSIGYNNYWNVLNACECGIPQNRKRVFMLSIRQDIDTKEFTFPKPYDSGIRLKNIISADVDDYFYKLNDRTDELIAACKDKIESFNISDINDVVVLSTMPSVNGKSHQWGRIFWTEGVSPTLCAGDYKAAVLIFTNTNIDNDRFNNLLTTSKMSKGYYSVSPKQEHKQSRKLF